MLSNCQNYDLVTKIYKQVMEKCGSLKSVVFFVITITKHHAFRLSLSNDQWMFYKMSSVLIFRSGSQLSLAPLKAAVSLL